MDLCRLIKPGDKILIAHEGVLFRALVEGITDLNRFLISPPRYKHRLLRLDEGRLFQFSSTGAGGVVVCRMRVVRAGCGFGGEGAEVEAAGEPERRQRRDSFRVNVTLKVGVRELSVSSRRPDNEKWHELKTLDISETGMLLLSRSSYTVDDLLLCRLKLDRFDFGETLPDIVSSVRRCRAAEKTGCLYQTGVKFLNVPEKVRYRLAKFIIVCQRMEITRGPNAAD